MLSVLGQPSDVHIDNRTVQRKSVNMNFYDLYFNLRYNSCLCYLSRAAHSSWNKAIDCALQCSDAVEKWDGTSLGGGSMLQTLKQAGIFGCLHAAGLAAKIAQYVNVKPIYQPIYFLLYMLQKGTFKSLPSLALVF